LRADRAGITLRTRRPKLALVSFWPDFTGWTSFPDFAARPGFARFTLNSLRAHDSAHHN
jgi:hypothetical protein